MPGAEERTSNPRTPATPDGTAEPTKQNLEAQPHPNKKIDPQAGAEGQAQSEREGLDFVRRIVEEDLRTGRWGGKVVTRFPPEPNGYLHIGHAKSICLNFGIAEEYRGSCNLRYDDTNPAKEEERYVRGIQEDIEWLGFKWSNKLWASDYFQTMYDYAVELIQKG